MVHAETLDYSGGQIHRDSTADDLMRIDRARTYPLAGPVWVEGAEPGDALRVEVLALEPASWGWACLKPGAGLLPPGELDGPYLRTFDLRRGSTTTFCPGVEIPISPFLGTMGVVPAGARDLPVAPPHRGGGNLDCRHLGVGATLVLVVQEPGGLFSAGDGHAAQGDGEVGISGLECGMSFSLRFEVDRGRAPSMPRLTRPPGPLTPRVDHGGWTATMGVESDLMEAARGAVRGMIDVLQQERGLEAEDAYLLCSLVGDLKIGEVVDAPTWVVSCFIPEAIFTGV